MWTPLSLSERAPTVLVADRTELLRRNVAARLQQAGYEVLQAADGREALAVLAKDRPDAALFDANLPGVTGVDLCRIAKSQLGLATAHLLVVASSEEFERSRLSRGSGPADVLLKPLELDELVENLNEVLAPLPRSGQVLMIRGMGTDRTCHVSAWRMTSHHRLSLDIGPEFDWLGGDLVRGVPVAVTYPGPHGIRLTLPATLRLVIRHGMKKGLDLVLANELPRRSPALENRNPALGVKYGSPYGEYQPAMPYNVSVTGVRLGGVVDSFDVDAPIDVFFFRQLELQHAVRGRVKATRDQDGRHVELAIAFQPDSDEQKTRLIELLKPGCLAPPSL